MPFQDSEWFPLNLEAFVAFVFASYMWSCLGIGHGRKYASILPAALTLICIAIFVTGYLKRRRIKRLVLQLLILFVSILPLIIALRYHH